MSSERAETIPLVSGPGERSGLTRPGITSAATVLVEVTLAGCWWIALYPLCRAAYPAAEWSRQLLLAAMPILCWALLTVGIRPAWWLERGSVKKILSHRLWPVVALATSPAYPAILTPDFEIQFTPVLAIYGIGLMFFLTLTPLGLGLRKNVAQEDSPVPGGWSERFLAIGGVCCALSVSGLVRPDGGSGIWSGLFLEWMRDALRCAGVMGLCAFLVSRPGRFPRWSYAAYRFIRRVRPAKLLVVCCLISVVLAGLFAWLVLEKMPHIQDEVVLIFQAKVFAAGHVYAHSPPMPEFWDMEYVKANGGRWYGKYLFGPALWFVPGVWLNCPWLVGPVFSGLTLMVLYFLTREVLGPQWGKGVILLAAISPWWIVTAASMMAHPGCMLTLLVFVLCFVKAAKRPGGWVMALLSGLFLGLSVNFRPYTALLICTVVVIGAIGAGWWRRIRLANSAAFLLGLGIMLVLTLAYNRALTGDPLLTPFAEWSPYDRLGFGQDVGQYEELGLGYTASDALENQQMRLEALGQTLTGWPTATIFLLVVPLLAARHRRRNLVLLLAFLSLVVGYFFYHFGFDLVYGPRYWSEALPACLMLVIVGLAVLRHWVRGGLRLAGVRAPSARSRAFLVWMVIVWTVGSAYSTAPAIVEHHGDTIWHINSGPYRAVQQAGLSNALVFVDTPHYRDDTLEPDRYGSLFQHMSPSLDDDVLFARDLGDERNADLVKLYPDRATYRLTPHGALYVELGPYRPGGNGRPGEDQE